MEIAYPPELSSSDISELTILMANMIDSFLQHNKPHEMNKHEQQNSTLSQRKISVCLPEAINDGLSTPEPGEYRTPICTERPGRIAGLASVSNQSP